MDKPHSPVGEPLLRGAQPDRQPPGILPDQIGETELDALNSALESLFTKLREAKTQFEQDGDNGRLGAFTALGAFWKFIKNALYRVFTSTNPAAARCARKA
jgi:hypothetical protein